MKNLSKRQLELMFKALTKMEDEVFFNFLGNENKSERQIKLKNELDELSTIVFKEMQNK